MSRSIWLLTLIVLLMGTGLVWAIEMAFEAEDAAVIEAPMVVGVPADGAAQGGPEPSAPSGGKFVWVPGPPTTGGGGEGYIEIEINIPEAGTYALWGHVTAWDGNSDSLWITWLPADPEENPQETQNTEFRWGVAQGNDWHWDRINQWLDGGTFEREWQLPAGPSKLQAWTREDATMLDSIYVTDNLSADEAEVAPKLPSEIPATAVEPHGKLAVSWGLMKR